jgi:hypothetical protein
MFRLPKSLILAAAGAGLFTSICGEGLACPPRGGGGGYRPAYYQPQYQYQPRVYQPQACQQPQIQVHPQQPQYPQQQVVGQQFPQQSGQFAQQPVQGQFAQQGVQQGQFASQGQVAQPGVRQTQIAQPAQRQVVQSGAASTPVASTGVAGSGAAASALNALGNGEVQGQQIQSQPAQQIQAQPQQQVQAQPQQVQSAPSGNSGEASTRSAADMALEALLGGSSAPVAAEAAPASAVPTGDYSASISNGARVRLSLRQDNSFTWIASKGDKQSSFSGSFSLNGSALTLLRSDNQKLEGTLTQTAAGFQLKLAGQNDAGLSFVRAGTLASR